MDNTDTEKDEKELLGLLYEAQEKMLTLIDGGEQDEDYQSFCRLISRLESYIQDNNQHMI